MSIQINDDPETQAVNQLMDFIHEEPNAVSFDEAKSLVSTLNDGDMLLSLEDEILENGFIKSTSGKARFVSGDRGQDMLFDLLLEKWEHVNG